MAVEIKGGWEVVVADGDIELTVAIEISDGDATAVRQGVDAQRARYIGVLFAGDVGKQTIVFETVPGGFPYKGIGEEMTLLVLINLCDRTRREGQSQIGIRLGRDPSVGGVNIEVSVVVHVKGGD